MLVESVTALAFGPLVEGTLDFGQGMTVVHCPNESGKTTWDAALCVGLCRMRRGSGSKAIGARVHSPTLILGWWRLGGL